MKTSRSRIRSKLFSDQRFVVSALVLGLFVFIALFADYLSPYPPGQMEISRRLLPPGYMHWLGCDTNGIDLLSAMLFGARISLRIAVFTVMLSAFFGVIIGVVSGFYGGWIDQIAMRVIDMLLAFPGILIAMLLASTLGQGELNIVFAISATGWIATARIVRGLVLQTKELQYVEAARCLGASHFRQMFVHILPACFSVLMIHATFSLSGVILVESSLSFLGLGAAANNPTWGALLSQGKDVLFEAPHVSIFPGVAILTLVLSLNMAGDSLRDAWDPKSMP